MLSKRKLSSSFLRFSLIKKRRRCNPMESERSTDLRYERYFIRFVWSISELVPLDAGKRNCRSYGKEIRTRPSKRKKDNVLTWSIRVNGSDKREREREGREIDRIESNRIESCFLVTLIVSGGKTRCLSWPINYDTRVASYIKMVTSVDKIDISKYRTKALLK